VQCYFAFCRLVRQGREQLVFPTVLARFAIRRYRSGRQASGGTSQRSLGWPLNGKRKGCVPASRIVLKGSNWQETLVEDRKTPIPDQVSFRVDFPEWLSRLSPSQRKVAEMFAAGDRLADVAQALEVSPSWISQMRKKLRIDWEEYHQEVTANR